MSSKQLLLKTCHPIWLCVDGGGTKTAFLACGASGEMVFEEQFPASNFKVVGVDGAKDALQQGFAALTAKTGARPKDLAGVVMGIAGCDASPDYRVYEIIADELGIPKEKRYLRNDSEVTFRAVTERGGLSVIGGTGSLVCAYDEQTLIDRASGWGAPLSDAGSGYWIGAMFLTRFLAWLDAAGESLMEEGENPGFQALLSELTKKFSASSEDAFDLRCQICAYVGELSVTGTAAYAKDVLSYAQAGDEVCMRIVQEGANALGGQIADVYLRQKDRLPKPCPVVLIGSLIKNPFYFQQVSEQAQKLVALRVGTEDVSAARAEAMTPSVQEADSREDSCFAWKYPEGSPVKAGLLFCKKRFYH